MLFGFLNERGESAAVRADCVRLGLNPDSRAVQFWAEHVHETQFGYCAMQGCPEIAGSCLPLTPEDIVARYHREGESIFSRLRGNFAIAIFDRAEGKLLLAIDRMGIERITYRRHHEGLVFGNDARWVAGKDAVVANQRMYDFLFFHMVPSPHTIFEGVDKLPPASMLVLQAGKMSVKRYWKPRYEYEADIDRLGQELPACLEKAVIDTSPDGKSGAFLSGGLDSSTVSGYLAQVSSEGARTFSIGFDVEGYDELPYARLANEHFSCRGHEYKVTSEDIVASFSKIAGAYDEPFGNSSVVPTFYCAKLAKEHGVDHLLAGDGGDELFAGNERYAEQKLFEMYKLIPLFLRQNVFESLARRIHTQRENSLLRRFRGYVNQALIPLPERLETWNFVYREQVSSFLSKDFVSAIDPDYPIDLMTEIYNLCASTNAIDRLQEYDWKFTLADNDLRKVTTMCTLAGVRVSFPMLHDDLLVLSTKIPPNVKLPGFKLRHFYKTAMRNFLPKQILNKSKHGFGLPFGQWLKTDSELQELVFTNLVELKARKFFLPQFIDRIISEQREGDASYYGYFIWDLAMLEEWLKLTTNGKISSPDAAASLPGL